MDKSKNLNFHEFFSNPVFDKKRKFSEPEAWLDMINMASDETEKKEIFFTSKGELRQLKQLRGEFKLNILQLSKRWNWSRYKIRSFLILLTQNRQITDTTITSKIRVIKICNYDKICPLKDAPIVIIKERNPQEETPDLPKDEQCSKNMLNEGFSTLYNNIYIKERENKENDSQNSESNQTTPNPDFIKFKIWLRENAPFCASRTIFPKQFTEEEFLDLKKRYTGKKIAAVIEKLDNRTDLHGRYYNLPLTVSMWLEKEVRY